MKFVLGENLFEVGGGYVGVTKKEKVKVGEFYYEEDNHTPVYSFQEDTLPEEYYLNRILFRTLNVFGNAPTLPLTKHTLQGRTIKEIETEDDVWECEGKCEDPDIHSLCNDGCKKSYIIPYVVDNKVIVKNIVYDDTPKH